MGKPMIKDLLERARATVEYANQRMLFGSKFNTHDKELISSLLEIVECHQRPLYVESNDLDLHGLMPTTNCPPTPKVKPPKEEIVADKEKSISSLLEIIEQQDKTIIKINGQNEELWKFNEKESTRYHALEKRWSKSFKAIKEGLSIIHEPLPTKQETDDA